MIWHLFGDKPLLEQIIPYLQLEPKEQIEMEFE